MQQQLLIRLLGLVIKDLKILYPSRIDDMDEYYHISWCGLFFGHIIHGRTSSLGGLPSAWQVFVAIIFRSHFA